MAAVYQDVRLLDGLTIAENVMARLTRLVGVGTLAFVLRLYAAGRLEQKLAATAQDPLEEYDLAAYQAKYPREVPYGVQRRAAITRATATGPCPLLLDEPAAGLTS
ncbi:MAG: ATP-binding cassette domain-containing protein [Firmicutes bacterium]|nr:ATP-binding cassette domain-containing protein [Bacillota bacterium]